MSQDEENETLVPPRAPKRSYGRRWQDRVTHYLAIVGAVLALYQGPAELIFHAWKFYREY